MTRAEPVEAQRRRSAVRLYKAGVPVKTIAQKLKQSTSWVYKWIRHQAQHLWTRFRSPSRAPHHRPTQTPPQVERRIVRLRKQLVRHKPRRLRFAGIGAHAIQREYRKRDGPAPSLSTIHRILKRHHLVTPAQRRRNRYRPHPAAEFPNAVQTTDIITRWIHGGIVVQTFNTIDIYSNDVVCTTHADKTAAEACQHLLHTWKTLGIPDWAQFDNEAAFGGGRHARSISQVVRLCLYFGVPVLFTPLGESSYNWPVEIFNGLWAKRFWNRHQFSRRRDVPRAQHAFVNWYRTQYIAPRQSDTPARLRQGHPIGRLPEAWAESLPDRLPICAGLIPCSAPRVRDGLYQFSQHAYSSRQTLCGTLCLVDVPDSRAASHGLVSTPGRRRVASTQRTAFPLEGTCATGAQTVRPASESGQIITQCPDNTLRRAGKNHVQKLHDVLNPDS